MAMSFDDYVIYCNKKRAAIGELLEPAADLKRSYRGYLATIELAGRDVDVMYEKHPGAPTKTIFVTKPLAASMS